MVSKESVEGQLVRIGFNLHGLVNRAEVNELPKILLPDEEIYECVSGYYEGGMALLVATNVRVVLIDKKPFNYLTVEDVRFDMINEMDYSHRMMGAQISISVGSKNLRFRSYNQPRLRKLINHVQHCIAESKKKQTDHQEGQNYHLEKINQQLQSYLLSQYQSQMEFNQRLHEAQMQGATDSVDPPQVIKPSPELADYLYSQSLLRQHASQQEVKVPEISPPPTPPVSASAVVPEREQPVVAQPTPQSVGGPPAADAQAEELYTEGWREIFGKLNKRAAESVKSLTFTAPAQASQEQTNGAATQAPQEIPHTAQASGLEVNPLRIAYSKLPMALRNRKFGRPSFHAHSHATTPVTSATSTPLST